MPFLYGRLKKGMDAWLESQEFYELCQAYRHARDEYQDDVTAAFEALKTTIRVQAAKELENLHAELEGLRTFKRSVDEALNSGDGSYRP